MSDPAGAADPPEGAAGFDADDPEHRLETDFHYPDEPRTRAVARSVRVEVGEVSDGRSRATVGRDGAVVTVGIDAADLVALRAGTNTWLRLVGVAEAVTAACAAYTEPGADATETAAAADAADADDNGSDG